MTVTAATVVVASAGVGGYAVTTAGLHHADSPAATASATVPAVPLPSAVVSAMRPPATSAASAVAPLPTPDQVAAALAGPLASPALGASVLAQVSDADSGQLLFARSATSSAAPASTAKITTAAAVLATHAGTDRITTTIVAGAVPGQVVLVGAGDPTLSGAAAGADTPYAGAARLSDLAAQLRAGNVGVTQVVVDGGLFTGPSTAPSWQRGDVPTDYASAITAVLADGGRANPTAPVRSATPDLAAGAELAADLGLPSTAVTRGSAPAGAKQLAAVRSAPYEQLVDQMLRDSDNVIAECLARQVAISAHQPVSFTGAAAAVRSTLAGLGVDIGPGMTDGSGLAATDRLAPSTLVSVLRLAGGRAQLRPVLDDLPVAGWDGTLQSRYVTGAAAAGAGLVRAKTGTLTSVSSLAGIVTTSSGRTLVFAIIAAQVGARVADTDAAEAALDVVAAALVTT